ncbi:hypothetical protein [Streptomyces luteogriseus]|uniref:Uncharacterized protein n=1 Tax=Streptomyces luteogriseus TaxID=68233 RepID=A0A7W7DMZ8_9ACTN|nr:hypothetical protein [Streptomyces luteogriseus]MBB4712979.1 hypothetical protein [Streptomyces luteogriseus]
MTTHTTAKPREDIRAATAPLRREPPAPHEPGPAEAAPFHPRARGRHRKPRPRKVLLAAGGLAVAAGALSLLRLASGPGTDAGNVEAGPRPDPVTTATDDATRTAATFPAAPDASPSSPTALGGLPPSPVTKGARPSPSATTGTPAAATAAGPASTTIPDTLNTPAPAPTASGGGDAPRPAPPPPAPPSRTTPAPRPEEQKKPHDPGLCVPVIGLCVDSPVGSR